MGNPVDIDVYIYVYTPNDEIKEFLTNVDYLDLGQGLSYTLPEDCLLLHVIDGRNNQVTYPAAIIESFAFGSFGFSFDLLKRVPRQSFRKKGEKVELTFQE